MKGRNLKAISLFSGAGGMDVGFENAGFEVVWANEIDKDAAATYEANWPGVLRHGDIKERLNELETYRGEVDLVFGGPPCQGFSVAGKMNPDDPRSQLLWVFLDVVKIVKPRAFVAENVKALGVLQKWEDVRNDFVKKAKEIGYSCAFVVLSSDKYGVPQKRERVFFIGFSDNEITSEYLLNGMKKYNQKAPVLRDVLKSIGKFGAEENPITCSAKITIAQKPILRKSPFAGMLFNGLGRPLDLNKPASTLPASMGGNKTPIVDEELLWDENAEDWIRDYHAKLWNGENIFQDEAPARLRRLTLKEVAKIQTFPEEHVFKGSKSSVYKQIGNAVPSKLAEAVGKFVYSELSKRKVLTQVKQLNWLDGLSV